MRSPRQSSAVLLTRGAGEELEVYLLERSLSLRFYGGYWAFPGGVLDRGLDEGPQGGRDVQTDGGQQDRQARCAQRELFEEIGVLLGTRAGRVDGQERAALRRELVARKAEEVAPRWHAACQLAGFEAAQLPSFARLVTPPFSAHRYDTSFHHAHLPEGEVPVVDGQEASAGAFFSPRKLLQRWRRGEIYVVPPVLQLLKPLAEHGLEAGLERCTRSTHAIAEGRLSGACLSPGILVAPLRTPTIPPATTTNAYLVGNEEVYVIDPATHEVSERERLFALCDEVAERGGRIAGVLLTHHHFDHVGSAAAVAKRYGVSVGAHPLTHDLLELGDVELQSVEEGHEFFLGTAPNGQPGWKLRALFTPGHAPGHLAFIESSLRGAIVGDLLSTLSTIVIDPPEGHMTTYLASLERLIAEDIRVLHPAHGLPTRDGTELVTKYLEHRRSREARLLSSLGPAAQSVQELVPIVYEDTPAAMHGYAERSLLAGLIRLQELGQATETRDGKWSLDTTSKPPIRNA